MEIVTIRRRSVLPLLSGLAAAQLIGTLFVGRSNLDLQHSVAAMHQAGWMAFPAGPAAQSLNTLAAAVWGGLFFTLSVGAGLTLATWAALYLWGRFGAGRPRLLWPAAAAWAVLLVGVNWRGGVLFPTLFALCVPLATLLAAVRTGRSASADGASSRLWPMPLITLALLTALWGTQLNQQIFIAIRDHLLLSNPVGQAVNDFYYRYTLHAAQSFKSFAQKTVRTCRLASLPQGESSERWVRLLAANDVLAVPADPHPDLIVAVGETDIELTSRQGDGLVIERRAFLNDPGSGLQRFSEAADRYAPLRRVTFAGLLVGFPILLFAIVDGLIGRLAGLFMSQAATVGWRCGVCLAIGLLLLLPLAVRPSEVRREAVGAALADERWPERVAALRLIEQEKLDLEAFPQYRTLLKSPLMVERYYVARTLAAGRSQATFADLLTLIRDGHPNVVCQAYYALGRRGNPAAVAPIRTQMAQSDHWYTQWYGYRALRSLGWRQTP